MEVFMGKQVFGAGTIAELDSGRVKAAIDQRIRECAADVDDRGEDGLPRAVSIVITFTPQVSGCEVHDVKTEIVCQSKVPPRRSRPYSAMVKRDKGGANFVVNEASEDNVKQGTLDEARG